jgi:uroporphyrinogen-III synthase
MKSILSTKSLKTEQKNRLLEAGMTVVDYDAISITFLNFECLDSIENAIFTSQQGVLSFLSKKGASSSIKNCFCVGLKTKELLEEKGLEVLEMAQNSIELSEIIAKKYKKSIFYYFCGTKRREELPKAIKDKKISLFEVKTYKTELKTKKFDQKWNGILFFSPSGVESYISKNKNEKQAVAFCIGKTTAARAKEHFKAVVFAKENTIEHVLSMAIETLK